MKTCGLDVHKDTIFCGLYNGKSYSVVQQYTTTIPCIRTMGEYLREEGVTLVAMESTGIYWVPIWDVLREMGFELTLVNPYLIKQMPGRKSDVKDAQWIACLLHKGMLRGSVVPCERIQQLRSYCRDYAKLQRQRTRCLLQMNNLLVKCGIRMDTCVKKLDGQSTMRVIDALIGGECDAEKLEKLVYANRENKRSGKLRQALSGNMREHHQWSLRSKKEQYDLFERQIRECLSRMEDICKEYYAREIDLLKTIPGISRISAILIFAEMGGDISFFETSEKLAGWAGLRPSNDESAGKYKRTAITKGNNYLKTILVQVAWAASRTRGSFFKETFNRLVMRKSKQKAAIAVARKILVVSWHLLTEKKAYNPTLLPAYDPEKLARKMHYYQEQVKKMEALLTTKKIKTEI